jgi:hypothetical protein
VHCGYFCIIDFFVPVMILLLKCFIIFVGFFFVTCVILKLLLLIFCVVFRFLGCATCFEALIMIIIDYLQNL